jgi:hypothetical protein
MPHLAFAEALIRTQLKRELRDEAHRLLLAQLDRGRHQIERSRQLLSASMYEAPVSSMRVFSRLSPSVARDAARRSENGR